MKFTPVIAAGLVAFATAQPARDARVARTPDTGFTVFVDEGCAGFQGNPKCKEYAEKCYKDSKNLATKQQVIDCTQAKLKADALGPGGAPSKEQLCAGYLDHPKCREFAQACDGESKGRWTGRKVVHCTQRKLVGPDLVAELCVPWENEEDCLDQITDCNTNGKVLTDCMALPDLYSIVDIPAQPAQS
ncbi:hypothetical protein MANI_022608 [Metarhizium anisopliae]